MKKRLLSTFAAGFLAAALVPAMAFATPAEEIAAAADGAEPVLAANDSDAGTSKEVEDVYAAYLLLQDALDSQDIDKLVAAVEDFDAVVDAFNELTEEQFVELAELLGVAPEDVFDMILFDWIDANVVVDTYEIYTNYLDDPNVKTALDLSVQYDRLAEGEEYLDLVRVFIGGFDDAHDDAMKHMASQEALSVYNAYIGIHEALDSFTMSELQAAAESFEAVIDTFNDMTEDQLAELAVLLEVTPEEAYSMVLSDWIDTNIILTTEELYQAYLADPNAETAAEFVAMYDAIYNDPAYEDEQLRMRLSWFIFDIEDVYADASALLSEDEGAKSDGDTQGKSGLAQTGDGLSAVSLAGLMTACLGGLAACAFALRRKSMF